MSFSTSLKNISLSSDLLGVFSSGLCLIHCLATPFIFIAQSCSVSCCASAPAAWALLDYIFMAISFFAVRWSTKTTSKEWIKSALWVAWTVSFLAILNERIGIIPLSKVAFYIPAMALIGLHLYNKKYCRCNNEACCAEA